jgi:iron(III) transport system ATP-binding protein
MIQWLCCPSLLKGIRLSATALAEAVTDAGTPPPEPKTLVSVRDLSKSFGQRRNEVQVLRNVALDVTDGELLVLLGPSGCGKTTLLRSLVGLERPDTGRIDLGDSCVLDTERGVFVPPHRRDVGMVFQNYALWPHMKVRKNVAYPLRSRGQSAAVNEGRVEEVLDIVQCGHLADRYPPELSGGQQQRVSLARALAARPALLLLDEPLSNLDALLRVELRAQLRLLHRKLRFTGVHVTHDQEEAIALGTRVAVMNAGRIEQIGDPVEVYRAPATEYVADFLGARNRIPLAIDGSGATVAGQPVRGLVDERQHGSFAIRLRDEHIVVRRAGEEAGAGATEAAAYDGSTVWLDRGRLVEQLPGVEASECVIDLGEHRLFARVPAGSVDAAAGEPVAVGFSVEKARCYAEDGRLVQGWTTSASTTAGPA